MHLLGDVFTSEHGEAVSVLQLLTKFKMSLSEIDTYLNEYGNRLNSIDFKNSEQDADILILKSQVASLQTKVNNIQLTLGDYLLRFQDLDIQLGVINGKIDINISDITNLETNINNIGIQIININNTLNLLDLTVQGHTTKITNLETNVNDIGTRIININNTINLLDLTVQGHTTSINNLIDELSILSLTVNNVSNSLVSINESITFINNNISAINTTLGILDGRIDVLEGFVNDSTGCLELDTLNSFEISTTTLPVNTLYNLWEYPLNVDTDKTLVNIQTSFAITSESTSMTINTPNGTFLVSGIVAGVTSPVTLNIDFMYKISNNVISYYGICTLYVSGKYPIIRVFSSSNNFPAKDDKSFPLDKSHLAISFSAATAYLQPHVKITKYKIGV